ncbi:MAG: DHHA1 domain-containing protein [Candidatus Hadarchaeales archaeon]
MYVILGASDVGLEAAERLRKMGKEVLFLVNDPRQADLLSGRAFKAEVWDSSAGAPPQVLQGAEVLILAPQDLSTAEEMLKRVKGEGRGPFPPVLALVPDELFGLDFKSMGADVVLPLSQLVADRLLATLEDLECVRRERELRDLLLSRRGRGRVLVVMQVNPDPDALASAAALKRYARAFGLEADIACAGEVSGYYQNRVMRNLLELELLDLKAVDFERYSLCALVDVSTRSNSALPEEIFPTVVIDHHSVPASEVQGKFKDIRVTGAASTLLAKYLWCGGVEVDPPLAAALALGIVTDTLYFTRGVTRLDLEVFQQLLQKADLDLLRSLQSPLLSQDAFDSLASALRRAKIVGSCFLANLGEVGDPESVPQIADFLLQREGIFHSLVYGVHEGRVRISARTKDKSVHLGQIFRELFPGFAGGHASMAAGSVPLQQLTRVSPKDRSFRAALDRAVAARFLAKLGLGPKRGRRK